MIGEDITVVLLEVVMLMFGNEMRGLKRRTPWLTNALETYQEFNWKL